ncbi:hypothetical protein O0I10_011976 [Lichtheimia ornata]|uniref:Uncharacterized protein n=1 Tax=Lichtheimia ornata TaxID=688661 RepID=A0AAD7USM4_9FUNG|nr:uncharacterized protein O0I10_011976 [Lichtheimia ornata]KAJ8652396.1 hypothetical protein O0I10_011976 [Lichtheimia ornata]
MAVVENISWSELLRKPIVTAQHGNDGNRIATATELLSNSAQFDTALRDAAAIRTLLPVSGLGYLCAGDVYCQQGHHSAAISIYDQGLETVPESDPYYQQLQQHRMAAVANNDKRVDFISRLPLDIVITNIVPRMERVLSSRALHEPLYVSRTWQERILQQPNGLRFNSGRETNTFKKGHVQLIRFAPHVQTLYVSLLDVRFDDLFCQAHFSRLKELFLECDRTTPHLPVIHGLQMIADSLTHLTMFGCRGLQLRDILETCPNLVFLKATHGRAILPLSPSSIYPKMKHLALHRRLKRPRKHEDMVDVIRRFPSLRMLELTPMAESSLLPLLHKHCPYLLAVVFENSCRIFYRVTEIVYPNRKGIETVYLEGCNFYKQDDLIQFLHPQRDSLQLFQFHGDIEINDNASWAIWNGHVQHHHHQQQQPPDYSPSFPQLMDFHLTNIHPSTTGVPMTLWILLNAHNLATIHIHDTYFRPNIVNAMIKLNHLQKVHIDVVSNENDDSIHQFLGHHIALGNRSTLKDVIVETTHIEISAKPWMPLLSKLPRLKNLELLAAAISENCIPLMEEIGQGCPALENLILGMDGAELADGLLPPLRRHPNLKWLKIGADEPLSNHDLMALCTFRSLKELILLFTITEVDLLEMLNDHIPIVEIEIDDNE